MKRNIFRLAFFVARPEHFKIYFSFLALPFGKITFHLPARPVGKIIPHLPGRTGYGPRSRPGPVQISTTESYISSRIMFVIDKFFKSRFGLVPYTNNFPIHFPVVFVNIHFNSFIFLSGTCHSVSTTLPALAATTI